MSSTRPSSLVITAVQPEDYADSPVHYAVATRDIATLTKIVSALPKLNDANSINTEDESLAEERLAEQISDVLDRRDNPLKETPLHVAVRMNDVEAARILAVAGANIYHQNAAGWHPLQEALLRRCKEIAPILVHHGHLNTWSKWRRRLPRLAGELRRMRDFYMEISFHFESSIVPFIGRVAPSDTYKIWKRAGNLRADTTLAGFDGLNFKRRNHSFLFINDTDDEQLPQGSLLVVKHDKKQVHVAEYQKGGAPMTEAQIAKDCNPTSVHRPGVDVSRAQLVSCKNWRRQERTEYVGKWKSRVYEMHNVVLTFRECKLQPDAEPPRSSSDKKSALPPTAEEAEFKKNLRPMLWLTEQFPLETEELQRLLDILSKKLKAVKRMREVLQTTFPPGTFPVKISIPVVPTVRVVITFTKFVELQPVDQEDLFLTPPSSPRNLDDGDEVEEEIIDGEDNNTYLSPSKSGGGAASQKVSNSSSGGAEVEDPFVIPTEYTWIRTSDSKKNSKVDQSTSSNNQE